jgi:hypothetical protein
MRREQVENHAILRVLGVGHLPKTISRIGWRNDKKVSHCRAHETARSIPGVRQIAQGAAVEAER